MEGEQFSLCWNNFHSNLSTGFHTLLKDEDLVDVTIAAGGQYLKAHRAVLSVCSPYFKDLFRANPSAHPIVILPEVNYKAICSLIHFMYRGEVSVSQEDIPTFMRVAELLKVKGLTDNNSSDSETNGFMNTNRSSYAYPDQRQNIMKRPRPVRKLLRPMHNPPITSPKLDKSPQPPPQSPTQSQSPSQSGVQSSPAKKDCLEENQSTPLTITQLKTESEPLIKPKEEPIDALDEENTSLSGGEPNLDLSQILDPSLGEISLSNSFQSWPNSVMGAPSSSPAYQIVRSNRGQLVFIYEGHIYTLCDTKDFRKLWLCAKAKTLNCNGHIVTISGPAIMSFAPHNHGPLHSVISKLHMPKYNIPKPNYI